MPIGTHLLPLSPDEAEDVLQALAKTFGTIEPSAAPSPERTLPTVDHRYQTLVEQLPAVVFMAFLDAGTGKAYVSPHIEATLGFSQSEWLEDPVRWYQQIHPDDKARWSGEAAGLLLTGKPLRSVYRVIARDQRVVWFQCEAKIVPREEDGQPWFIHGVAFDITDLKQAEAALDEERNFVTAILDTVGALVVVLNPLGGIVRFNRACEETTGFTSAEVHGRRIWDVFLSGADRDRAQEVFAELMAGRMPASHESRWATRDGRHRLIDWSHTVLRDASGAIAFVIATGLDVTDRRALESAVLDISEREQVRIGEDLHDGLGQHLTAVAFLSKVLQQKLADGAQPAAADAERIAQLVNQGIAMTRELSHGLLAGHVAAHGLSSALHALAAEIQDVYHVTCRFTCDDPQVLQHVSVATHLFRIAQEAVNNAMHHGGADEIMIDLAVGPRPSTLTVSDNGTGFPAAGRNLPSGMGLRIMRHRAAMIGGSLTVERVSDHTVVTCAFPATSERDGDDSPRLPR